MKRNRISLLLPNRVATCALAGVLLLAGLVSGQESNRAPVSISGEKSSMMPKSHASIDSIRTASAAIEITEGAVENSKDGPSPGPLGPGPGCNLFPAPASTGASVPLSYFGPPPSASNPSLVGPYQLLQSGKVDVKKGNLTLPLYEGYMKQGHVPVWYVLTDVDDQQVATLLGLNFSAKLTNSGPGARTANFDSNGDLIFNAGSVDFSPERRLAPGSSSPFPPSLAQPGSRGDSNYSPLVRVLNAGGIIYNASIVAFGVTADKINFPNGHVDYTKVHDQVLAIDPYNQTVTVQLINGFSFGRPLWYMSMDASTPLVAAIEGNTYAPLLSKLVTGKDDSFSSPVERIFIAINGPMDCANPKRQGLNASITDGFRPNNTFGGIPTIATDYSPMWNGQLYQWSPASIKNGYREQLREEFQILTFVRDGLLTGPNGTKFGDSGFIINCPPVQRLE